MHKADYMLFASIRLMKVTEMFIFLFLPDENGA
jgi:hypothetical protein